MLEVAPCLLRCYPPYRRLNYGTQKMIISSQLVFVKCCVCTHLFIFFCTFHCLFFFLNIKVYIYLSIWGKLLLSKRGLTKQKGINSWNNGNREIHCLSLDIFNCVVFFLCHNAIITYLCDSRETFHFPDGQIIDGTCYKEHNRTEAPIKYAHVACFQSKFNRRPDSFHWNFKSAKPSRLHPVWNTSWKDISYLHAFDWQK